MSTPLLTTKLYIPHCTPRDGLAPALDRAAGRRPAPQTDTRLHPNGSFNYAQDRFGKTTLQCVKHLVT
ncbi:MAG: hypothetical protein U9R58_04210 [Chloroflexota bacterium]|nr:hypothetical protein [Chloroflexota bacterium]